MQKNGLWMRMASRLLLIMMSQKVAERAGPTRWRSHLAVHQLRETPTTTAHLKRCQPQVHWGHQLGSEIRCYDFGYSTGFLMVREQPRNVRLLHLLVSQDGVAIGVIRA